MPSSPGKLIVISGPSGAGKTTVIKRLLQLMPELRLSTSATTRAPRPGEVDGIDYYFLAPEEFQRRRQAGEFVECVEVFGGGHWYGTLDREVSPSLTAGKSIVLEIDVQGALAVQARYPQATLIFIHPGSLAEVERRLRGRGTENEAAIARRLANAQRELQSADHYHYQVHNQDVDQAAAEIRDILLSPKG